MKTLRIGKYNCTVSYELDNVYIILYNLIYNYDHFNKIGNHCVSKSGRQFIRPMFITELGFF